MSKKLDFNTIMGFLLIGGIFLYFGYFGNNEPPADASISGADSTKVEETVSKNEEIASPPEAAVVLDSTQSVVQEVPQVEELYTLENELVAITFSNKGGQIKKAHLKKYKTYDSLPLYLINDNSEFNLQLQSGGIINTADQYFVASEVSKSAIKLSYTSPTGGTLHYHFELPAGEYMLNWDIRSDGMGNTVTENSGLQWEMATLRQEKNIDNERVNTHLNYRFTEDDDTDELSAGSDDEELEENVKWVAYKQQFFSSILINKSADFKKTQLISKVPAETEETVTKYLVSKVSLAEPGKDFNQNLGLYLGPNKYEKLAAFNENFEKLIPLGWGILGWINRGLIINMFNWLEGFGINYGIIILIIALVIKMILFPFTYTSYRSMAKMRVLKPEIDELNEKFKDKEPMKKQQATMELYRKAGVNPLGGCIPMLFQMPILIALFRFFPSSIELRQQSFLWADDLSTYDSIWTFGYVPIIDTIYGDHVSLFTLLMTVSTLIYTYMNQQMTGSNQQYPQLKYMMYLMPVVFLGVFNNYAAGLSYYYFVANVITFGQQFAIRAFIDEDKIHAKIQEKKAQPQKENRLMRRMKELQEDQSRQARRKK